MYDRLSTLTHTYVLLDLSSSLARFGIESHTNSSASGVHRIAQFAGLH